MISRAQQSVNDEWNAMAGEWDDVASDYRDALLPILWRQTNLKPEDPRVVLDFGCGTGLWTEAMRNTSSLSTQFVCIDAAPSMVRVLREKIKAGGWENVTAYNVALASYKDSATSEDVISGIESLKGSIDLVVASSVMRFIPPDDLPATMKTIGELLRLGGIFFHSDWPKSDEDVDGFTEQTAEEMYSMGSLVKSSSLLTNMKLGGIQGGQYLGVAVKPEG